MTTADTNSLCCPICQQPDVRHFCTKYDMEYLTCDPCRHVFLKTLDTTLTELNDFYVEGDHHYATQAKVTWDYSDLKKKYYYTPLIKPIERRVEPGRILDIGCANGGFLGTAKDRGWEPWGIELNGETGRIAQQHGVNIITVGLLDHKFEDNYFDAVTMWNVFEHLPDINQTLTEIHRILKPGGVLALSVPHIRSIAWYLLHEKWDCVDPPVHLNLFTRRSLRLLTEKNGFTPASIQALDLKPSTIKDYVRQLRGQPIQKSDTLNSTALMMGKSSQRKTIWMLRLRILLNIPLRLLGWGEDLYGYFVK